MVYRIFFLGRNSVSSHFYTKIEKNLKKNFKNLKKTFLNNLGFVQPCCKHAVRWTYDYIASVNYDNRLTPYRLHTSLSAPVVKHAALFTHWQ